MLFLSENNNNGGKNTNIITKINDTISKVLGDFPPVVQTIAKIVVFGGLILLIAKAIGYIFPVIVNVLFNLLVKIVGFCILAAFHKTAGRRKTEFIKKYPGRMKIIQLGYFREQRAKVRACTRPWRLPRKQKETRKACFFLLQMKFYFSSPRALRSILCQKPFFFAGCSKEPRMPRTPVM